jgi:hypothetical protein
VPIDLLIGRTFSNEWNVMNNDWFWMMGTSGKEHKDSAL